MRDLRGKVIVITGASSGIGAATARACARAGMDMALSGRRVERLDALAGEVRSMGRRAETVPGDVAEPGMSDRLLDTADERLGGFDVVFANAGYSLLRSVLDQEEAELRRIFDVNFFAPVALLRAAARRMLERQRPGHLLMCSSCVSKFSLPRHAAYSATKAAQNHFCAAMRLETRGHGIDVSSVHPITTSTELFEVAARLSGTAAPPPGPPAHTPRLLVQPPERVARAIVRCLRRPCPEVWTSHLVRTVAGAMTAFPRFGDFVIGRRAMKDQKDQEDQKDR